MTDREALTLEIIRAIVDDPTIRHFKYGKYDDFVEFEEIGDYMDAHGIKDFMLIDDTHEFLEGKHYFKALFDVDIRNKEHWHSVYRCNLIRITVWGRVALDKYKKDNTDYEK